MPRYDLLFSMMTRIETELWVHAAAHFRDRGFAVGFLLYDESARPLVEQYGFVAISAFDLLDRYTPSTEVSARPAAYLESFGLGNVRVADIT